MKNKLIFLFFLLFTISGFAQETKYKEYSYTELFNMIEEEKDSIFELNDAIIKIDSISDKQFILNQLKRQNLPAPLETKVQINKHIAFNNVIFDSRGAIFDFSFNKSLKLVNCVNFYLYNSEIEKDFSYIVNKDFNINIDHQMIGYNQIIKNTFSGRIDVILNSLSSSRFYYHLNFDENNIDIKDVVLNKKNSLRRNSDVYFENNIFSSLLSIEGNRFRLGNYSFTLTSSDFVLTDGLDNTNIFLIKNDFSESKSARIFLEGLQRLELIDNIFPLYIELTISEMRIKHVISWNDFKNKIINSRTANMAYRNNDYNNRNTFYSDLFKKLRVEDEYVYNGEMKIRGQFIDYYKRLRNLKSSNSAYVEMKDLETERLKYLHEQNTTFETFFTFKINQFLKVFSAYGTKPARAIVFSIYVILIFALIYLFFPNSWDKHGKNRIVDRFNFFFKYMRRKAGIHEVYLEEQNDELLSYNQFKENISSSKQKVPAFFTATALPLYKWAISGTKLSASLLKRVDIMKGSWNELPKSKRIWKSILLISAFVIAVVYDIFIKMLNALMLSINTFTTLGFGEIPIKGLPRYLAIIQGFIGWFMLTIFSVSLISQLLN